MTEVRLTDQTRAEATGWLVSAVGRDFMLEEVERAEGTNDAVAAQLRDWTERLTGEYEWSDTLRRWRIRQAADALEGLTLGHTLNVDRSLAEELAIAALKGAGVIR